MQIRIRGECQIYKVKVLYDYEMSSTLYEFYKSLFLEHFFFRDKLVDTVACPIDR